jgi:NAD(P)-dependent dehydrogenase (short-subunit alcohol dehydrogenase family)
MSRILITGSAEGLGLMAAQLLIRQGHEVTLHARNQARAADAWAAAPGAARALAGDRAGYRPKWAAPVRPMTSARRT